MKKTALRYATRLKKKKNNNLVIYKHPETCAKMCDCNQSLGECTMVSELENVGCTRSVRNRTAVVYHMTNEKLGLHVEKKVLFAACMSYSLKECCASTDAPGLMELRRDANEVDVAAIEALIFEYVRPHVVLIESCMRLELKVLTLHVPRVYAVRESVTRLALALSQNLYKRPHCLFPESCARACLLAASSLYLIEIDDTALSADFRTPLVRQIRSWLLQ